MKLLFERALLPAGWASNVRLSIAEGRIASVEADAVAGPEDERHAIALPGMPNVHSHAFQRGMAGLAERRGPSADDFWTWREVMYRFLDRLTPEDVEAIAAQLYVEMLEAGFTRVGEFHYLHHDEQGDAYANPAEMAERIAAAASSTGIGLTLLPVFYAHSNFGGVPPVHGQRRFISGLDGFARLMEGSRRAAAGVEGSVVGVAPHSLRAVTPEELAAVVPLAEGGPVHIHAAEQVREVSDCLAWSGKRPVDWLVVEAGVDRNWCLIHATHMTEEETGRLARAGAVAGLCPVTEANLGDGTFNAGPYLAAGGAIAVGSDSNVLIGVGDELRQLEYSQRLHKRSRNVLAGEGTAEGGASTGRTLFDRALAGGAQALGSGPVGLTAGAWADIVTLDRTSPALIGRSGDALIDSWVFAASRPAVDSVWSRGRRMVSGGRHHARESVAAAFARTMERILA
ncbi:formimidoylglutamate deiminase [Azospirillum sp. SYSU D00513]|uniref:formimidoylglutamate deiminase n=1 Tax=Azospirillum sp. SYSU D00513 TaxID=2812561 RepID=UPI001A96D850|nr:formimidoylglutamate deiminase [Azospirillum sp. SYSU D00513]